MSQPQPMQDSSATLDELARLASEKMQAHIPGYRGRKCWERMSEEYRHGWRAMTKAVLEAIEESEAR